MIDIAIVEDNREQAAALESHIKTYAADHKLSVSVSIFYEPITFWKNTPRSTSCTWTS